MKHVLHADESLAYRAAVTKIGFYDLNISVRARPVQVLHPAPDEAVKRHNSGAFFDQLIYNM
jgi:hypothetical protein